MKPYTPAPGRTHIAGQRVRDQDVLSGKKPLMLTDSQAEHELRIGSVTKFKDAAEKEVSQKVVPEKAAADKVPGKLEAKD